MASASCCSLLPACQYVAGSHSREVESRALRVSTFPQRIAVLRRVKRHVAPRLSQASCCAARGDPAETNGDARAQSGTSSGPSNSAEDLSTSFANFCIIEGRDTVQDFARMQLAEIRDNIASRRNRIFLLMEEVRRLRIQQRIKAREQNALTMGVEEEMPEYPSSIPFLPPLTIATLQQYYGFYFLIVGIIIAFGGYIAPILELKLGIGGTSYEDFIRSTDLPLQLSQVDPIVASFSGGAVGVISALMVVEINNVKQQEHKRCKYCQGTGYLACARCSGTGALISAEGSDGTTLKAVAGSRCPNCAGSAKVMCPTCLCTGMALATEHDPRIDPFV